MERSNIRRLSGDITEDTVVILWEDQSVGTLTQRINDACEEEYVFKIDWDAWDRIQPTQTIAGLNMDLRKEEYVRNFKPAFMTEFLPPASREDANELMAQYGLEGPYDMWEFMIACKRNCRDKFRVERLNEYLNHQQKVHDTH